MLATEKHVGFLFIFFPFQVEVAQKKKKEVNLIPRHLLLPCREVGLISATFYKAPDAVSCLTDITYRQPCSAAVVREVYRLT